MTAGEPVLIRSVVLERIGVPHAFTTRVGGVSTGVFASLNFGNPGELPAEMRDPTANIRENIVRVLRTLGCAGREVVEVHQVHGAAVRVVRRGGPSHEGPHDTRADAITTDDPGRMAGVRVADCVPVLLASEDGRVVAAVHAGWRGVIGAVVSAAVSAMGEALGAAPLAAAIGPCIGPERFEVGPEVVAAFERAEAGGSLLSAARPRPSAGGAGGGADRALLDLQGAIEHQCLGAGVGLVEVIRRCTVGEPEAFFSHRRDGGVTGRMMALIGPRA